MRQRIQSICALLFILTSLSVAGEAAKLSDAERVLAVTKPLEHPRGGRPPLILWSPNFPTQASDDELERILKELNTRGIAFLTRWQHGKIEQHAPNAIRIAKLQKKLGMETVIDGTGIAHGFYDGTPSTGHVSADGKPFFDSSFFWRPGCPFAVQSRFAPMRERTEAYLKAYAEAGVPVDYWLADWEFDGPEEWNDGWASAQRCTRCQEKIPDLAKNFEAYSKAVRSVRAQMQREVFTAPILKQFPAARVGNYAIAPHDGHRYWWDFFEQRKEGLPYAREHKALYRPWADEFTPSGYTCAMPVLYTWYHYAADYEFKNPQYRWFYPLLKEATSAARHTPKQIPSLAFVHWTTTNPPKEGLPQGFEPMSRAMYQEFLWHALLRGHDGFAMWCPANELEAEVPAVHEVYAQSQAYAEFLEQGEPVLWEVPAESSSVISALKWNNKYLVRRTDFEPNPRVIRIDIEGQSVDIPSAEGKCQLIEAP